ncbi:MAG: HAMP domain-containing histidine kinase [Acidobacteria bacterium]|nr:HAMP domain-containing histidine kinase [Acidobacteriota bacterium]
MKGESELTVAGLAHDLNNVFATLLEAADVLSADAKWTKLAGTIRRNVRRGERIVDSLEGTLAESGDLGEILDNAVQHAGDVLTFTRGNSITPRREIEGGIQLPGSAAAWERVFVNLFLNAAQAAPDGVEVVIRASQTETATTLTVADNGPGIAASILPNVFEADITTKRSRGRRGLGLHIVHAIVTGNGGDVMAENGETHGAIFTIRLPRAGVA